jgi:hypothetical protein
LRFKAVLIFTTIRITQYTLPNTHDAQRNSLTQSAKFCKFFPKFSLSTNLGKNPDKPEIILMPAAILTENG